MISVDMPMIGPTSLPFSFVSSRSYQAFLRRLWDVIDALSLMISCAIRVFGISRTASLAIDWREYAWIVPVIPNDVAYWQKAGLPGYRSVLPGRTSDLGISALVDHPRASGFTAGKAIR
jgi:hypothetical protein